jgi:hypothetical protein
MDYRCRATAESRNGLRLIQQGQTHFRFSTGDAPVAPPAGTMRNKETLDGGNESRSLGRAARGRQHSSRRSGRYGSSLGFDL